mmetsp:Transcript_35685/g.114138  ORF Transcript_35685/g.114138 Transcript_35685/m.114138 type:complete len:331 (-) Transcript_35685:1996-2988(-)
MRIGVGKRPPESLDLELVLVEEPLDRVQVRPARVASHDEHRQFLLHCRRQDRLVGGGAAPPDGVVGVVLLGPPLREGRPYGVDAVAPLVAPAFAAVGRRESREGREACGPGHGVAELEGGAVAEEVHVVLPDVVRRADGDDAAEFREIKKVFSPSLPGEAQREDPAPGAADEVDGAVAPVLGRGPDDGVREVQDLRVGVLGGAVRAGRVAEPAAVEAEAREAPAREVRPGHGVELPRPVATAVGQLLDQAGHFSTAAGPPEETGEVGGWPVLAREPGPPKADGHEHSTRPLDVEGQRRRIHDLLLVNNKVLVLRLLAPAGRRRQHAPGGL